MREDPILPGGVIKLLLVLLVAGVIGVVAFAVIGDGLPFDLPDLPEIEDSTGVTTLSQTELQETTIDGDSAPAVGTPVDPFTSTGVASALRAVRAATDPGAQLTRVTINDVQTQFIVRKGRRGVEAYSVRADSGELVREHASITISGTASLEDFAFALAAVKPAAIDRMLSAARRQSGAKDFRPSVLTLERAIPFGSRELRWAINVQAGGRYLLYRARPNGSGVSNAGGEGIAVPPAAQEAQELGDCISAAGDDTDKIMECLQR